MSRANERELTQIQDLLENRWEMMKSEIERPHHFVFAEELHGVDLLGGPVSHELDLAECAAADHLDQLEVLRLHAEVRHRIAYFVVWGIIEMAR